MRIGILGGSFNPVHFGHLALAQTAQDELSLDRVLFIPAHLSPLKKSSDLWPQDLRITLLRLALKGRKGFGLELCEVKRGGASYTVDTLRYLRRKFGRQAVFYFICGADTARQLSRWKSPGEVLKLCRFVIANRPGAGRVFLKPGMLGLEMAPVEISATDIRRKAARRTSLAGLLPAACIRHINKNPGGFLSKPTKR